MAALLLCLITASVAPGTAAEPAPAPEPASATQVSPSTNGLFREVRPGHFTLGQIRIDQAKGTLTFPATVNLREGAIEYLVVTDYGKIHESLLRTSVTPYHVQLALLLLGLEPRGTNTFVPPAPAPSRRSASVGDVTVDVSWTVKGRTRRSPAGDYVRNLQARRTIGPGRWVFAGSRFREDGFAAQTDGSIITVIDDPDAIIASVLPGSDDDDNWLAVGRRLPPMDTPVEIILTIRRPGAKSSR